MKSKKEKGWSSCETLPILLNLPKMENRPHLCVRVEGPEQAGATSVSSGRKSFVGGLLRKMDGGTLGAIYLIGLMI